MARMSVEKYHEESLKVHPMQASYLEFFPNSTIFSGFFF